MGLQTSSSYHSLWHSNVTLYFCACAIPKIICRKLVRPDRLLRPCTYAQLVLKITFLAFVCKSVRVSTTYHIHHITSLHNYATTATSTVEATGHLQALQTKVCQASLVLDCPDGKIGVDSHDTSVNWKRTTKLASQHFR